MSNLLHDLLVNGFPTDNVKPCFLMPDGCDVTYAELLQGAASVAGQLVAEGVTQGDRVALQAEKSVEGVMFYLGALKAGAAFVPLNSAYTPSEVAYFLSRRRTTGFRYGSEGVRRQEQDCNATDGCNAARRR
jgi:malonyl-CoA/methylmalonyl-CoA synthetase